MARHEAFDDLLKDLTEASGVSREVLAEVLRRVMIGAPHDVPRTDIAKGVMLADPKPISAAGVSKAVRALVGQGLLEEDDLVADAARAGRPIKPLRLNGKRWALIGIKVVHTMVRNESRPMSLTGVVTTLAADPLGSAITTELPQTASFSNLAEHIADFAESLMATTPAERDDARELLAVGVEIAGHVHDGRLIGATHVGLPPDEEFDLETPLQARLQRPVIIDNDVNVLAVRETYKPNYPERDVALVAVFEDGVGGSLIVDREVYRGSGGMTAEPGHQYVSLSNGRPADHRPSESGGFDAHCHCGAQQHVDCYAVPTRLRSELSVDDFDSAAATEARREQGQLTPAGWAFQRGGEALGQGIASLINVVNPARMVILLPPALGNGVPDDGTAAGAYLKAMEAAVTRHSFSTGAKQARAGRSTLTIEVLDPDEANTVGARCAAIRALDSFVMHARGRDDCG